MLMKKASTNKIKNPAKTESAKNSAERRQRILNTMMNTTIIVMSMLMGGLSQVMVDATSSLASGMAEAFDGEEEKQNMAKKINERKPESMQD